MKLQALNNESICHYFIFPVVSRLYKCFCTATWKIWTRQQQQTILDKHQNAEVIWNRTPITFWNGAYWNIQSNLVTLLFYHLREIQSYFSKKKTTNNGDRIFMFNFWQKKKTNGYSHCLEIAKANIMQCYLAKKKKYSQCLQIFTFQETSSENCQQNITDPN